MGRFSPAELLMILGVALLLFGPGRLAGIGKGLGEGIKNLKKGLAEVTGEELKEDDKGRSADAKSEEQGGLKI